MDLGSATLLGVRMRRTVGRVLDNIDNHSITMASILPSLEEVVDTHTHTQQQTAINTQVYRLRTFCVTPCTGTCMVQLYIHVHALGYAHSKTVSTHTCTDDACWI